MSYKCRPVKILTKIKIHECHIFDNMSMTTRLTLNNHAEVRAVRKKRGRGQAFKFKSWTTVNLAIQEF